MKVNKVDIKAAISKKRLRAANYNAISNSNNFLQKGVTMPNIATKGLIKDTFAFSGKGENAVQDLKYNSALESGRVEKQTLANNLETIFETKDTNTKTSACISFKPIKNANAAPETIAVYDKLLLNMGIDISPLICFIPESGELSMEFTGIENGDTTEFEKKLDYFLNLNFSEDTFKKAKEELKTSRETSKKHPTFLACGEEFSASVSNIDNEKIDSVSAKDVIELHKELISNSKGTIAITMPKGASKEVYLNILDKNVPTLHKKDEISKAAYLKHPQATKTVKGDGDCCYDTYERYYAANIPNNQRNNALADVLCNLFDVKIKIPT